MSKIKSLSEKAEQKARQRDFENEKILTDEELKQANDLQAKANSRGMKLVPEKKVKNKAKFAQIIQANLQFLFKQKYITGREKIFLMDIIPYIAFSSNAIVLDIKVKSPMAGTITEIAKLIDTERSYTNKIINSLKKKGLIFKGDSGIESNNAKAYTIFLNPHIIYAGDKDNVNETLKIMFQKAMKMQILKDLPERLF